MKKVILTLAIFLITYGIAVAQDTRETDGFIYVPGIEGESLSPYCMDCIDILTLIEGQSAGQGNITFTKSLDSSSIEWRILAARGELLPEVTILFHFGSLKFWEMKLTNVTVKSVSMESIALQAMPQEKIELVPTRIQWTYVPQRPDGQQDAPITGVFDYKTKK
jgi:type VI protein secretion system component Hcp